MNKSITSSVTGKVTGGQKKQIRRLVNDALDSIFAAKGLDKNGAQEIINNGGNLKTILSEALHKLSTPTLTNIIGKDNYVVEILLDTKLVEPTNVPQAQAIAKADGISVLDALFKMKLVTREDASKALANQFGMDFIKLAGQHIPDEITATVPRHVARHYKIMPVSKKDDALTVAISDPMNVDVIDSLRYILKRNVEAVIALEEEIDAAIKDHYGEPSSQE